MQADSRLIKLAQRLPLEIYWGAGVALGLLWVYFPALVQLANSWESNAHYSHGFLVPGFAGYLLWRRRSLMPAAPQASWWGLPVLGLGLLVSFTGTYLFIDWFNALALLPLLAGLAVLVGGWPALRWAWQGIAFLLFMVPLPFTLENALSHPLQRLATVVSTFALQTMGFAAYAEGNIIRLGEIRIGVVEACSGLGMLIIFFAMSAAVAILIQRSLIEKTLLFLSAIPIAILSNVIRIIVTGILHKTAGKELADLVFHDLAGWLMMPLALGFMWVELRLFDWIFLRAPAADVVQPNLANWLGSAPKDGRKPGEKRRERRKDKAGAGDKAKPMAGKG